MSTLAEEVAAPPASVKRRLARWARNHPIYWLLLTRIGYGIITLVAVAAIVFFATNILPGNAAIAVLGHSATPESVHALEVRLGLDQPLMSRFVGWVSGSVRGDFGDSLVNGQGVVAYVTPKLVNSAVLVGITSVLAAIIGIALGALAALRRDSIFDHFSSLVALVFSALPEYVSGVFVVAILAVNVFQLFPAVSVMPPGTPIWQEPIKLVLPVITLLIVTVPYIMRMTRAATIEALESDYVQLARLKGVPAWRVVLVHALPNAMAPSIQVLALTVLYLAGSIVLVEVVFTFPGIGTALVDAVNSRDIPVVQYIALVLAVVYVVVNIVTDALVLLVTPRRRLTR